MAPLIVLKNFLILSVALLHFYFLVLEMFLWTKPMGLKVFQMTLDRALSTSVLAANQGLYNGFLASGLIWSVFAPDPEFSRQLSFFFLGCVLVAALYGGYSVGSKILFIQGIPAILALAAIFLAKSQ